MKGMEIMAGKHEFHACLILSFTHAVILPLPFWHVQLRIEDFRAAWSAGGVKLGPGDMTMMRGAYGIPMRKLRYGEVSRPGSPSACQFFALSHGGDSYFVAHTLSRVQPAYKALAFRFANKQADECVLLCTGVNARCMKATAGPLS